MVIELKIWNSVGGEEFHDKLDYIMKWTEEINRKLKVRDII
jgi:hypothetical protein